MVEFNLLPDVKLEFIKARNLKRLVISVSTIVSIAFLAIFILLVLFVDVAQKVRVNNLKNTITSSEHQIYSNANGNLNKILTIQKQLQTLPTLESQTPEVSRLFNFLSELTPANATISTLSLSMATDNISVQGTADNLNTVNQFVDTLQFTTYSNGTKNSGKAFKSVSLDTFGYNDIGGATTNSSYSISFDFNPDLLNPNYQISLVVPQETTTRSVLDAPNILFKSNPNGNN